MKFEEEGYIYEDYELDDISDNEDIRTIRVFFTEENDPDHGEMIDCLANSDEVSAMYEDEFTDNEYHKVIVTEDSDTCPEVKSGMVINIAFDENGVPYYET